MNKYYLVAHYSKYYESTEITEIQHDIVEAEHYSEYIEELINGAGDLREVSKVIGYDKLVNYIIEHKSFSGSIVESLEENEIKELIEDLGLKEEYDLVEYLDDMYYEFTVIEIIGDISRATRLGNGEILL